MAARRATRPTKTVGQDAALQIASEFSLHIAGDRTPIAVVLARQREVGLHVLLDKAVEG
jgi:hypothetical protein